MNLVNGFVAFRYARITLEKRYKTIFEWIPKNKKRHLLLRNVGHGLNFYCLYKKDFFQSFNSRCPGFVKIHPELSGLGESINESNFQDALNHNATLIYIYPDGSIYGVHTKLIDKFFSLLPEYIKNEMIRTQDKTNFYKASDGSGQYNAVLEQERVFPIKWLERLNQ
jgi:hypothetical protein